MEIQRWQPDEGVLLHATRVGWFVSYTDHVAHTSRAGGGAARLRVDRCRCGGTGLYSYSDTVEKIDCCECVKARAALDGQP